MKAVGENIDQAIADIRAKKEEITNKKESGEATVAEHQRKIHQFELTIEELDLKKEGIESDIEHLDDAIYAANKERNRTLDEIAKLEKEREDEHQDFLKGKADDEQAIQTLNEALDVLKKTWGQFLQKGAPPPPPATFEEPYEAKGSDSILAMLEAAVKDVEKDIKTSAEQEDDDKKSFNKAKQSLDTELGEIEEVLQ